MLSPSVVSRVLEAGLMNGADFAEIFVEDTYSSELSILDSRPHTALVGRLAGAGIRLFYGHETIYVTTNDLTEAGLIKAAKTAAMARKGSRKEPISAPQTFAHTGYDQIHDYGTVASSYERDKKLGFLKRMDRAARDRSSLVVQVQPRLTERNQKIMVANSLGVWAEEERNYSNASVQVHIEDKGVKQAAGDRRGELVTPEFFESFDFEGMAHSAVDRAKLLIHADYCPAGEMPVIIDGGFGGVIFHEACGHGLETTSVAKGSSVFCGKMGEKIAHECVTAVDDGTVAGRWGSLNVDDEGRPTEKTVLIENGVLKSYIVDQMGARQTGLKETGSGRRESYKYAPASRMRNTYIAPGKDKLEDMIRDIDYGLFAKVMGGGSVTPGTGEYNFGVQEAYLVKNGKIEKAVKGATLIGKGIETLGRIMKVGDNFSMEAGMCGSVSGAIPTTCGQPALLVSNILVGGRAS